MLLAILVVLWPRSGQAGQPVVINDTAVPPLPALVTSRVSQGEALYAQHCAACHGVKLEGATDWKIRDAEGAFPPPPHDSSGHTWHHSDGLLLSIIENGGDPAFNSKMPAFRDTLTTDEIFAVLEFIKSHWGKDEREYQWWITATGNPS